MSKAKVVLAGLQADNAEKLKTVLETAGFAVVLTSDPREAVQAAVASPPDLILLNLAMPTSGIEALQLLSENPHTAAIPIIVLSAATSSLPNPQDLPATVKVLVPGRFEPAELLALIDSHVTPTSQLQSQLKAADPDSQLIASDLQCQWIRSRLGIVGIVSIDEKVPAQDLRQLLSSRVNHAYAMLDSLPAAQLSSDDAWNLLLVIAIPWTKEEVSTLPEIADVFSEFAQNLTGSRKIILWKRGRMSDHLGPLGEAPSDSSFSPADPLRAALAPIARDQAEYNALTLLFKRRISEEELEQLIEVLGRMDQE